MTPAPNSNASTPRLRLEGALVDEPIPEFAASHHFLPDGRLVIAFRDRVQIVDTTVSEEEVARRRRFLQPNPDYHVEQQKQCEKENNDYAVAVHRSLEQRARGILAFEEGYWQRAYGHFIAAALPQPPVPKAAEIAVPAKQEEPDSPTAALQLIAKSMRVEGLKNVPEPVAVGTKVTRSFSFVNRSGTDLAVPASPSVNGPPVPQAFVQQNWIERLGVDPKIAAIPAQVSRQGNRYATGGVIYSAGTKIGKDQSLPGSIEVRTDGFPPGKYRIHIDLKGIIDRKVYQTASADFELRAETRKE